MSDELFADRLRIEGDGSGRGTTVYLDGEPLRGLTRVRWETGVDLRQHITLEAIGRPQIHVEAKAADG
jgi:hypothetical protein